MKSDEFDWLGPPSSSSGGENIHGQSAVDKQDIFGSSSDTDDLFGTPLSGNNKSRGGNCIGSWHTALTLLTLPLVTIACFLMAYTTRLIPQRGALILGCTFAMPAAVIMGVALLLEIQTSAMNPSYSRKGQLGVALITVLACFIIGCFGEVANGFSAPPPPPTATTELAPSPGPITTEYNYIILLDKSASMSGAYDARSVDAVHQFLKDTADGVYIGLIAFCDRILEMEHMQPLDDTARTALASVAGIATTGMTNFTLPILYAQQMIREAGLYNGLETRILMVTDGDAFLPDSDVLAIIRECREVNASVSCMSIDSVSHNVQLNRIIRETGGMKLTVSDVSTLYESLTLAANMKPTPSLAPMPVPSPEPIFISDVVREIGASALEKESHVWIAFAMFIAEGIVLGVALSLMLSRQGQKRLQPLLSILMGVTAVCFIRFAQFGADDIWMKEGVAFSLYGFVVMRKNS